MTASYTQEYVNLSPDGVQMVFRRSITFAEAIEKRRLELDAARIQKIQDELDQLHDENYRRWYA